MTATQLDGLVTLLRSRAVPPDYDVAQARARFEKTAVFLGGAPDAKCEKVDAGGVPSEWVMAPGCDSRAGDPLPAWRRLRHRLAQHPSAARL